MAREMLVLEQRLVEKIDENRGDVSRAEFIDFCIDKCLEAVEPKEFEREERRTTKPRFVARQKEATAYATKEEFQEFKHGISNLIRTFLEFFITVGLELGTSKTTEDIESLKAQLRTILEER